LVNCFVWALTFLTAKNHVKLIFLFVMHWGSTTWYTFDYILRRRESLRLWSLTHQLWLTTTRNFLSYLWFLDDANMCAHRSNEGAASYDKLPHLCIAIEFINSAFQDFQLIFNRITVIVRRLVGILNFSLLQ
jgi:hypothetical protein